MKLFLTLTSVIGLVSGTVAFGDPVLTTLASFDSGVGPNYTNVLGAHPYGALTFDSEGNLFGTTDLGGPNGDGTIFELSGNNFQTMTTVVTFNGSNGSHPLSGLTTDAAGNFYGTTYQGGAVNDGTVYELSGANHQSFSTVTTFNSTNGAAPHGALLADAYGNLYGTTTLTATTFGSIFELSGQNHQTLTTLATFQPATGVTPGSALIIDGAGDLYGTTPDGGAYGAGTVYELPAGKNQAIAPLVSFNNSTGVDTESGLVSDAAGNLYGTTPSGGPNNAGSVFELSGPNHQTLTVLMNFTTDEGDPSAGLIIDAAGNLFGTTAYVYGGQTDGTIFELPSENRSNIKILATFDGSNGESSVADLTADAYGNLFGTTLYGGANNTGTVFELTGSGFVVPEPTGLPIIGLGAAALFRRRRAGSPRCIAAGQ